MNQKAADPIKARRGRPPAFDADAVVSGAIGLFWAQGFHRTSLQDISKALRVRSSTLYNSFGGKDGLYQSAVESYLASSDAVMFAPLRDGSAGLDDLLALLERQRASLAHPRQPAGCLLINAMVTGEAPAATDNYRDRFLHAIDCALCRAVKLGEIDPAERPGLAAAVFSAILGANVAAKSGATPAQLNDIIDGLIHTITRLR